MKSDIDKILGYEIKKELADRYFGFRKLIEQDKETLAREVRNCAITLEQKIGIDLARLYILLQDEKLIHRFLDLAGFKEDIFYDPYLIESSSIRKRVFEGVEPRGFTRRRRFVNLVADSYRMLELHVSRYRERFKELEDELETIKEEIRIFHEKHNIGSIMNLLRNIDSCSVSGKELYTGIGSGAGTEEYERKLKLEPPPPLEQQLSIFPPLVPFERVRSNLKQLANRAYELHRQHPEIG